MTAGTAYKGTLELAIDRATLTLQSSTSATALALDGFSRWENGKLTITVRSEDTAVTFTCDDKGTQLDCSYDDDYSLFGSVGGRPQRVVFSRG